MAKHLFVTMLQTVISIIILCSSVAIIVQNYGYWAKYHERETLLWVLFGIVSVCAALYFVAIQYVIHITAGNVVFLIGLNVFFPHSFLLGELF
jgi:hypothetical protein